MNPLEPKFALSSKISPRGENTYAQITNENKRSPFVPGWILACSRNVTNINAISAETYRVAVDEVRKRGVCLGQDLGPDLMVGDHHIETLTWYFPEDVAVILDQGILIMEGELGLNDSDDVWLVPVLAHNRGFLYVFLQTRFFRSHSLDFRLFRDLPL